MPLSTLHTESGLPSGRSRISALGLAREHVPRRPPLHPFGRVVVSMRTIQGTSLIAASTLDFALDSNDGDAWDASWPWYKIGPPQKRVRGADPWATALDVSSSSLLRGTSSWISAGRCEQFQVMTRRDEVARCIYARCGCARWHCGSQRRGPAPGDGGY
jgi:hypothetical protein